MADYRFGYGGYNPSYEVDQWADEDRSYTYDDHMARPTRMDPDGRSGYTTAWNPGPKPNSYIVQTETYIVHRPAFGGYCYPPKAVNYDYEVVDDSQWHRSQPVYGRPPEVDDFLTKVRTEASRPMGFRVPAPAARNWPARNRYTPELEEPYPPNAGNYEVVDDSQRHRSQPVYGRPPEVDDFLTKVQTEASRPMGFRVPAPAARNWPARNRYTPELEEPYSRYHNDESCPVRFGTPPPATGKWVENPNPGSYGRYPVPVGHRPSGPGRVERSTTEPPQPAVGSRPGWVRPSQVNSNGRPGQDPSLSKPINDMNTAVEYLKEAIKPFSSTTNGPNSEHSVHPIPGPTTMPKKDAGAEVSKPKRDHAATEFPGADDAKPHSNSKSSPEPEQEPEPEPEPEPKPNKTSAGYRGTINAREAAKRFNGVLL